MSILALASAVLLSGQTTAPAPRSGSDLTRDLNSAPPSAVQPQRPAPTQTPPPAAHATAAPVPRTQTSTTQTPTRQPPASPPPAATSPRPSAQNAPGAAATAPAARPQTPAASAQPQPQAATSELPAAPPAAPPTALTPAAVAALPFRLEMPADAVITASRAGSDANVYAVRRGDRVLLMIYAGPASQFPIFDGQMVRAGGRSSVVVTEGGRRLAMEHLFQRATAPTEIHVWVASPGGADRDLAERIGQSVDVR
ncbi:hypothetical protein [Brevundimonas sp.]|uniref:hypothetical protein n=1 Tax=Brevundimonas sp. TaxID=1871086 RepID=UPI001AD3398B|nr:hypothetical protein [Brevundimonas sp.]MBN9465322.1 hypothetical protein [Brevundimonas sp.]